MKNTTLHRNSQGKFHTQKKFFYFLERLQGETAGKESWQNSFEPNIEAWTQFLLYVGAIVTYEHAWSCFAWQLANLIYTNRVKVAHDSNGCMRGETTCARYRHPGNSHQNRYKKRSTSTMIYTNILLQNSCLDRR